MTPPTGQPLNTRRKPNTQDSSQEKTQPEPSSQAQAETPPWWQSAVFYQIYPRSFQDSGLKRPRSLYSGTRYSETRHSKTHISEAYVSNKRPQGVGDLAGIIQRLPYLAKLGIDALWLSPFYPSPMADFGYDISDYCAIDPLFGTMADFELLVQSARAQNIRIIIDLVVNHSSDQHPWFQQSCDPNSDKADWYLWHDGNPNTPPNTPPNNWLGCFGGSGWSWHQQRQAWYYHSFLPQQPDLNWRNPDVRQAIKGVMDFWLAKGVDGFRLDVVNLYLKDEALRNNPQQGFWSLFWQELKHGRVTILRRYDRQQHIYDRDRSDLSPLLKQMRQWLDAWPDKMMVGEVMLDPYSAIKNSSHISADNSALVARYYGNQDQLSLAFNFEFLHCDFDARQFRAVIEKWQSLLGPEHWPNYTLSNHDFPRHASRYASDNNNKNNNSDTQKRLKLLAMMLLTLRGTPFLYYGEELGMPEQRVSRLAIQDPLGKRYWPLHPGRDGCRRPMAWSDSNQSDQGFSRNKPWLPHTRHAAECGISVEQQEKHPGSLLRWYRQLLQLRKRHSPLAIGEQQLAPKALLPDSILAYTRHYQGKTLLVLLNFSHQPHTLALNSDFYQWLNNRTDNNENNPSEQNNCSQLITLLDSQAAIDSAPTAISVAAPSGTQQLTLKPLQALLLSILGFRQ